MTAVSRHLLTLSAAAALFCALCTRAHAVQQPQGLQSDLLLPFFALVCLLLALVCALLWRNLRKARGRLRSIEECYQILAQHSVDFIWQLDAARTITFASPAVERVLGYTPEEYAAHGLNAICAPVSRETLKKTFAADVCPISGAPPGDLVELRLVRKDGSSIWTETSRTPLCAQGGQLQGFICVTRDIEARKRIEHKLNEERQRFGTMAENSLDPLLIVAPSGDVLFGNPAAHALFPNARLGLHEQSFGLPIINGTPAELDILTPDGECRIFEMHSTPVLWDGEEVQLVSLRDVTQRKQAEEALRASEERYRTVADHTHDCEVWIGQEGDVLFASPSCERVVGLPLQQFSESSDVLATVIAEQDLPGWREHLRRTQAEGYAQLDYRITHTDGRQRWICQTSHAVQDEAGCDRGLRCNLRDITRRKLMEDQLRHQALHDPLTGLGNRLLCQDRIRQGLERARRRDDYFYAVVFLGLDRFKMINESLGHAFGDQVLLEVSKRLSRCVRHLDTVARFEGDEFVLFLEELSSPREATSIVKRIYAELSEPYEIDGKAVRITVSMGVVLSPADYEQPEDLLRNANIALHHAKEAGRDRFKVFTSKMLDRAVSQMHLENDLRRGIDLQEFFLVYQPIVRLDDGLLLGFEALLRWRHPEKGLISPAEFIPMAEETGLIIDLGAWVLHQACTQFAVLLEARPGPDALFISVNISGRQFSQPGLVEAVKRSLQECALQPELLKLEITETTIMENPEMAAEKLLRLKNLGVTLSIDDFGTGYSSLSYLQRFPLDNLKIDLSFVSMMDAAPENIEIVKAIIDLAHTLGLEVVAEGVENPLQRQTLAALGCEYAQGFHFSPPVSFQEALTLVREAPLEELDEDDSFPNTG